MYEQSLMPTELQSFNYYLRKIPMFLRQDEAFCEHFKIWFDLAMGSSSTNGVTNSCNMFLYLLNIFDEDYLSTINSLEGSTSSGSSSPDVSFMLDLLAEFFGISRHPVITYTRDNVLHTNEELSLNNAELLLYIQSRIIRNCSNGSFEQLRDFYLRAGLHVYILTKTVQDESDPTKYNAVPAHAWLCLASFPENEDTMTENVIKLFLAGELRLTSMGITYEDTYREIVSTILVWDTTYLAYQTWDVGYWEL